MLLEESNLKFGTARVYHLLFALLLCYCHAKAQAQENRKKSEINLADPTVFYHKGTYYLYGTVEGNTDQGFKVNTSKNLRDWKEAKGVTEGFALRKEDAYGTKGFWAPQVFHHQGKFYMAYTANEQIAIAEGNSPLGPFTQQVKEPLAAPIKQIDPFVFVDDDGKKYLYHVRLKDGNRIYVAEMNDDFSGIKEETLQECVSAKEPWENTANVGWPVAEGPTVLKHKGLYYMTYSANDFRNPDYAVGYAVSRGPLGPWVKQEHSPIISSKNIRASGTGHGDFVKDKIGNMVYVFHTHQSGSTVGPRKTAIVRARFSKNKDGEKDELVVDSKSFFYPRLKF